MSLINDALKRARQAPPPAAASTTTMQPVDGARPSRVPLWLVLLALLPLLSLTVWLTARSLAITRKARAYLREVPVAAREKPGASPAPASAAAPAPRQREQAAAGVPSQSTNGPVQGASAQSPGSNALAAVPAEPAQPVSPGLRLQGIFYRVSKPSALINGKTVFVGDTIDQAKVLAIQRDSVTLEVQGQRQVLGL